MKDDFALAVEKSTASFISKNNLICGSVFEKIADVCSAGKDQVILCFEKGWHEAGRKIKEILSLNSKVVSFCLEEEICFEKTLVKLLATVDSQSDFIIIGSEEITLFVCDYLGIESGKIIYVPLDFQFSQFISCACYGFEKRALLLDGTILSKCAKNRIADGIRCVFSRKLIFVEMLANEVIAGLTPSFQAKNLIEDAQNNLQLYLKTHVLNFLVTAILQVSVAQTLSGVGNVTSSAENLLFKSENLSLKGEREYLFYKMVLRIYNLYFSNDLSCAIYSPGIVKEIDEIKKIFPYSYEKRICLLPTYVQNRNEVEEYKQKIIKKKELLSLVKKLINDFEKESEILKKEYGGRAYTVEHYSVKQRAKALSLAPYITKKTTAFNLILASGLTYYFNK